MLSYVLDKTKNYIAQMPKDRRKKYGQFFTSSETAMFMSNLFNIPNKKHIKILDPGAGSGILSAALLEMLQDKNFETIELICYENDNNILPLLKSNLDYLQKNSQINLNYKIIEKNYITSQADDFNHLKFSESSNNKYDLVIGNPPYLKIAKDAPEALAMPQICYGAPNLYFIFAAMSLHNLKQDGELVYIIPRSWTSGAYFKQFRKYFLTFGSIEYLHIFVSRNKVFEEEQVLQETMIIKVKKKKEKSSKIVISTSVSNSDFININSFSAKYEDIVVGNDLYVFLPCNNDELSIIKRLQKLHYTLPDIGLKMKTGLTVDFRNRELLTDIPNDSSVPIFYSQHIKNGTITFPINRGGEFIATSHTGLIQDNKNYLFIKRFTAKEEKRRLQCGIYLSSQFPKYKKISTQNKINFIDSISGTLSEETIYGLYVLFNSSTYDKYYRILNGSTQVNSTEINTVPVPDLETIKRLGENLKKINDYSEVTCEKILETSL